MGLAGSSSAGPGAHNGNSSSSGGGGYGSGYDSSDAGWGYGPTRGELGAGPAGQSGSGAPLGGLMSSAMARPGAHNALSFGGGFGQTARTETVQPNAVAEALDMNDAMRQVGAITGDEYATNRENIFNGEVGKLNGVLASSLRDAYSPRTTGFLSMVKNMFTTPENVDTPYSALNSLISSGYAAPAEDGTGFKATPKATLGMLGNFAPTLGIVRGALTGNPAAAMPSPMSVISGLPGAIGLANQMQVAGITPAKSSGASGDSTNSRGGGGDGVFNADAQYVASMNSPLVAGSTIDPAAWFANRRGLLG